MATANSTTRAIPRTVLKKLIQMRGQLTRWLLVHGVGRWLMVVLGVLAVDIVFDRLFKMDFAQRLVMLVVMAVTVGLYFAWRVIRPLGSRPNDEALIYEVEHKNPELKESLISSVQLARQPDLESLGMSASLADATIQQGFEKAGGLDFRGALDLPQHFRNWVLLLSGILALGLLGVGVSNNDFLRTWFNRNILLMDDQWPQTTYLKIEGVENGKLVLPRGSDHRQIVTITEDSSVQDVSLSLEIDNPGGRTIHQMKTTGKLAGREHMFMFHNVSSKFTFRARGGDDVTEWVEVELVEPPNVQELSMKVLLPKYTGIESVQLNGNGPHAVLVGSQLRIDIKSNKALTDANLRLGEESFAMNSTSDDPKEFGIKLPGTQGELRGGEYEIELLDETGLKSSRRSKFKITIREDDPPKVRASLLGISGLVSTRAMLPTSYQTADEYGLTKLTFDCNWKTGVDEERPGNRELVFKEFDVSQGAPTRDSKDVAVLDLLPFKLDPGTSFRFAVTAFDNHPEEPKVGRSQEFLLRVVSDEELRGDLLRREIEQRKAFDQAYQIQMELSTELQAIAARQLGLDKSREDFDSQREAGLIGLVGNQKGIGTAIDRIASRFEEFLVEVKNNRLDEAENEIAPDQRIETRFDQKIIQPIRRLDQELVTLATRHMDNCRRAVRNPDELQAAVDEAVSVQQQILEEMKRILNAMNDSESFQEIINDILEVKQDATGIKADIKNRLKPKDVFDDDDDVFDK